MFLRSFLPLLPPESGVSSTTRTRRDNSPSFADCCSVRNLLMNCGLSSTPGQRTLDVALDMQTCPAQLGLTWSIFSFPLRICLPTFACPANIRILVEFSTEESNPTSMTSTSAWNTRSAKFIIYNQFWSHRKYLHLGNRYDILAKCCSPIMQKCLVEFQRFLDGQGACRAISP
jgi:hypothetical protein